MSQKRLLVSKAQFRKVHSKSGRFVVTTGYTCGGKPPADSKNEDTPDTPKDES